MNRIVRLNRRTRAATAAVLADGLSRGLAAGAVKVFVLQVCAAALGVVSTWILSRWSTPAEFGAYASVLSVVALLGIPVALGFDSYLIPGTARLLVQEQYGALRGLLRRSQQITLVASLVLILAGAALPVAALLHTTLGPYLVGLASLPFSAFSRLRQATLTGIQRVIEAQLAENLVRPSALALLAAAMAVSFGRLTSPAMLAANLAAVAAAFTVGSLLQRRHLPRAVRAATPTYQTAAWVRASIHFVALTGSNQVMVNAPLVVVGIVRGPADAALFAMAARLASLVVFGYVAVNVVLAPATARLWEEGDRAQLQRVVTFTARLALLSTLPVALVFLAAGQWVLAIFGSGYSSAATALAILTIGQVVNAATGNVMLLLTMTGHESQGAGAQIIVAAGSIPLVLILVPILGVNGAALSSVIALVSVNGAWMWLAVRKLGIAPTALGRLGLRSG